MKEKLAPEDLSSKTHITKEVTIADQTNASSPHRSFQQKIRLESFAVGTSSNSEPLKKSHLPSSSIEQGTTNSTLAIDAASSLCKLGRLHRNTVPSACAIASTIKDTDRVSIGEVLDPVSSESTAFASTTATQECNQCHQENNINQGTDVRKTNTTTSPRRRRRMCLEIADGCNGSKIDNSNGERCIVHTPTLDELQSYTFSNFVRQIVLPKAFLYEFNEEMTSQQLQEYSMKHPMHLTQGMAKIRLPDGFFPNAPYSTDRSGRGPRWLAGTELGDRIFHSPIQQNIRGMAGIYEYTHTDLKPCTLAEFRDRADKYRIEQIGSVMFNVNKNKNIDSTPNGKEGRYHNSNDSIVSESDEAGNHEKAMDGTMDESVGSCDSFHHATAELSEEDAAELERLFWKRLSPTMSPAVYGADEAGTIFGDDPAMGWSLAQLDSCLHVLSDIPGVTSPYLYVGMWSSVFCAHAEDMNLLSINYLHAGQPKLWYAVAQPDAARFVSLAEHHYVHQAKQCKEFLRHKRCLLSPAILKKAGIRYQTAIQYPGEAIITFPGGFHFGFNAGFNVAEATNFGVPEWVPFGRLARVCLCRPDSVRIDMDRLSVLLQRYEKDKRRNKRLTWKKWRQRLKRQENAPLELIVNDTTNEIIEIVSCAHKKRKPHNKLLSEQQRKNEFWVEVKKPGLSGTKKGSSSTGKNSTPKKGKHKSKQMVMTWHLARPIGRKRLEVHNRVLCLLPAKINVPKLTHETGISEEDPFHDDATLMDDVSSDEEKMDEEEEECFAGTIVEVADGYVRVHFDGLHKTDDLWILNDSPKLFLDGGRWEEQETKGVPHLHYWQEMDSKKRLCF